MKKLPEKMSADLLRLIEHDWDVSVSRKRIEPVGLHTWATSRKWAFSLLYSAETEEYINGFLYEITVPEGEVISEGMEISRREMWLLSSLAQDALGHAWEARQEMLAEGEQK